MSVGRRIQWLRLQSKKTQLRLAKASGLSVSYLSRLENDRITSTVGTLGKIAHALGAPLTAVFESEAVLEAADQCPVSLSGSCILDRLFVGRGKEPKKTTEAYSPQQLQALRLCNFLVHTRDKELLRALPTMLKSFLVLSEVRAAGRRSKHRGALRG